MTTKCSKYGILTQNFSGIRREKNGREKIQTLTHRGIRYRMFTKNIEYRVYPTRAWMTTSIRRGTGLTSLLMSLWVMVFRNPTRVSENSIKVLGGLSLLRMARSRATQTCSMRLQSGE